MRRARLAAAIGLSIFLLASVWGFTTWYMAQDARLGVLYFATSCGWRSQREFVTATSLLHLFQFADADRLYNGIVEREPGCAIAYWGIAMSRLQNPLYELPSRNDMDRARQALLAAKTAAHAGARERAYLNAAGILFAESAMDWPARFAAYAAAMRQLAGQYPTDLEATIFYALALNWEAVATGGQSERTRAAELLLLAFSEDPQHPGISHYLTYCLGHARYQPKPFEDETMTKPAGRIVLGALTFVVVLATLAFIAMTSDLRPGASGRTALGGPFALRAGDGSLVTDRTFRGRWMLVYFGYTHCPDICPTTLLAISQVLARLGPLAARVQPIFITIDPQRDTPQVTGDYVKSFDPRIVGLSGSSAEIATVAKQYRVFYKKAPIEGSNDYFMDHSSYIYVMGPDGRYVTLFSHQETDSVKEIEGRLRKLLTASPQSDQPAAANATVSLSGKI